MHIMVSFGAEAYRNGAAFDALGAFTGTNCRGIALLSCLRKQPRGIRRSWNACGATFKDKERETMEAIEGNTPLEGRGSARLTIAIVRLGLAR
jgi:hypothetical protein